MYEQYGLISDDFFTDDDRCTPKRSTTMVVDSKRELRDCRPVSQIKVVCNIPASRVCIPCTAACVECMQNSGNHSPCCSHLLPRPLPFRIIPRRKKKKRKVAIQSLTLNQFLGERKKNNNSMAGELSRSPRRIYRRVRSKVVQATF